MGGSFSSTSCFSFFSVPAMICCTMIIIIIIIISPKKGSEQGYLNKDTDKGPGQMKDKV